MRFINLLAVICGVVLILIRYRFSVPTIREGDIVKFSTLITEVPREKYGKCQLVFRKIVISSSSVCKYGVGEEILVTGVVSKSANNVQIKTEEVSYIKTPWYGIVLRNILKLRGVVEEKVKEKLPEPEAGLLLGITLGVKDSIPRDFYDKLVKTGTIHVAVVSGYNISLLLSALLPLFGVIKKKGYRICVLSLSLLLYVTIVGFNPPVVRAAVMGVISFFGLTTGRQREALRILLISCFIILLVIPSYLTDISFQLSFGASLGMLLFYQRIKDILKLKALGLEEGLYGSLSSQIVVLPLISYYFGRVSIISLLSNFVTLWVIALATILGFVFFCVMWIPLLSNVMSLFVYLILNYFVVVNSLLSDISFSQIEFKVGINGLVFYYVILFGWVGVFRKDKC